MEIEGMLQEGRMSLSPAETEAVDALISAGDGASVSFTREGDHLIVYVGDDTYDVGADGSMRKRPD